ncbi:MAG: putative quinol monooxygenase [Rhodothermia bacterium]|nr:MAG: putative quinol monooxygenase [Rhodothermia bacterium]
MVVRIVRMSFHERNVTSFLSLFHEFSDRIRAVSGCNHLELWQDMDRPNVMTTYSLWDSVEALEAYRESELFRTTWEKARVFFDASPVASSHTIKVALPASDRPTSSI